MLSADESCCAWLCASAESARALLTALAECAAGAPLAVRLAYVLGNMAAADEHARINVRLISYPLPSYIYTFCFVYISMPFT